MEQVTTSLFDGVSKEEYAAMMTCFKTVVKTYRKGEEVPMPTGRVGVVQRGNISLVKTDINGVRTLFEQLGKGGVFGDALGFYWADASFFLLAEEDCDVLYIDYEPFDGGLQPGAADERKDAGALPPPGSAQPPHHPRKADLLLYHAGG